MKNKKHIVNYLIDDKPIIVSISLFAIALSIFSLIFPGNIFTWIIEIALYIYKHKIEIIQNVGFVSAIMCMILGFSFLFMAIDKKLKRK